MIHDPPTDPRDGPDGSLARTAFVTALSTLGLVTGSIVGITVWSVLAFAPILGPVLAAVAGLAVAVAVPATIERLAVVATNRLARATGDADELTEFASTSRDEPPSTTGSRCPDAPAADGRCPATSIASDE